jgi:ribose transport system ATP-binding protein/rhamnose transport system ATP-binding protein
LHAHRVTGIYGLVGAGRSETALAAFGHLRAQSGRIVLDGAEVKPRHPAEAIALGLAYLPEDRQFQGIFAGKSLENNLTANALGGFSGVLGRLDIAGLKKLAGQIMRRYNIKSPDSATPIVSLSGGNQQKALFARWANLNLKVLILDEPTRGIDVGTKAEIHKFIRELAARGLAIAVISSDLDEVLAVSDEVIVMRGGAVVTRLAGEAMGSESILAAAIGGQPTAAVP